MEELLKVKEIIKDLELNYTENFNYREDLKPIAEYTNHEDSSLLKIFFDSKENITILDFYDNRYQTIIAFKNKHRPDNILLYHTYFLSQKD